MKVIVIILGSLMALGLLVSLSIFGWFTGVYDTLVERDQKVKQCFAQIENALQRQNEVIPNLVELLKGETRFEKDTLVEVTQARASLGQIKLTSDMLKDPNTMAMFNKAQSGLAGTLSKLMMVTEKYPDLKANQGFKDVRTQLEGSVNRIAVARSHYNEAAADFNTYRNGFVNSFIADRYKGRFDEKTMFTAPKEAHETLRIKM